MHSVLPPSTATTSSVVSPNGAPPGRTHLYQPEFRNGQGEVTTLEGPAQRVEMSYTSYAQMSGELLSLDGNTHLRQTTYTPTGETATITIDGRTAILRDDYPNGLLHSLSPRHEADSEAEQYTTIDSYQADDNPLQLRYRNGVETEYQYYPADEATGWLRQWTVAKGDTTPLGRAQYRRNRVGQVAAIGDERDGGASAKQGFNYTETGWLQQAAGPLRQSEYETLSIGGTTQETLYLLDDNQLVATLTRPYQVGAALPSLRCSTAMISVACSGLSQAILPPPPTR